MLRVVKERQLVLCLEFKHNSASIYLPNFYVRRTLVAPSNFTTKPFARAVTATNLLKMPTRVVLPAAHAPLDLEEYVPTVPGEGQVQIELKATSLSPLDWKRIAKSPFIPSYPHVLGMDIAGIVVDKGTSTRYEVGDRIMGIGSVGWSDGNSFQLHVLIHERDACQIPQGVSFTDVATVPFALATAFCALFLNLGLSLPTASTTGKDQTVLIWGASGSVGAYAVQLALLAGYRVVATCSAQSISYVQSLGASSVLDASAADVVEKIRVAASDISLASDTVVTEESVSNCVASFAEGEGGFGDSSDV